MANFRLLATVSSRAGLASLGFFLGLWVAGAPSLAGGAGFPGTDYDLASLVGPQSQASFDPSSGTVITTGTDAKLYLMGLAASPSDQVRVVEVQLIAGPAEVQVFMEWTESSGTVQSNTVAVPADSSRIATLNLTTMGSSQGPLVLNLSSSQAGSVITRVTLVEREKPNLILLMVDDLSAVELAWGFGRSLPSGSVLEAELVSRGTTFEQFFNTTPLCCPSRTSYLTGQYSQNHGVYGNNYGDTGGFGGWRRFWELGHEFDSIGSWMQAAGYQTVLIGKFLNQYPDRPGGFLPETYVPAGWDEWYATFTNETFEPDPFVDFSYTSFRMNENGNVTEYQPPSYLTDVESAHAVDYVDRAVSQTEPFFMYLAPFAPHGPTEPAERHDGAHASLGQIPIPPSFNEIDLSDKPSHIRDGATQFPTYFGSGHLRKLDMTLAVDEMIDSLIQALTTHGVLDNTYIFFVSDNGLMAGEHGIGGKSAPYEESIRVPMIVRGPFVEENSYRSELLMNIDIAPTFLELGGAEPPASIDGESFVEVITGVRTGASWRDVVQVELLTEIHSPNQNHIVPPYFGARGSRFVYMDYETGDLELYDLVEDPFELESFPGEASSELLLALQAAVGELSACSGQSCRDATRRGWPTAVIEATCVLRQCQLDAAESTAQGGDLVTFSWDFGDGTSGSGVSVVHNYARDGSYTVDLTVIDELGISGTARKQLVATDPVFVDGFETGDTSLWSAVGL